LTYSCFLGSFLHWSLGACGSFFQHSYDVILIRPCAWTIASVPLCHTSCFTKSFNWLWHHPLLRLGLCWMLALEFFQCLSGLGLLHVRRTASCCKV
jgi:hypothetical protein